MLWVSVTIAAAFFQNLRSALQKALKGRLSLAGAAYARFFYGLPVAALYLGGVWSISDGAAPALPFAFFVYCFLGAFFQILFTVALLWLFSFRSFAVGTTFSKLEVIFVAGLGAILLGDAVGPLGVFALALGVVGTVVLAVQESAVSPRGLLRGLGESATLVGLLCAFLVGASSVFYRGASLALGGGDFLLNSAVNLTVALAMQVAMMGVWFALFARAELLNVVTNWRLALPAGVAGALGSIGWFTAFALQNAAYVRAVGQIELVFTFAASIFIFKERIARTEWIGVSLIVAAILMIVLAA